MAQWVNCTMVGTWVNAYDISSPEIRVGLVATDGSFIPTLMPVPDIAKREMLAIALTAITSQAPVYALVDDPSTPSQCYALEILSSSNTAVAREFASRQRSIPDRAVDPG
jgi:hypothetical protein